MSNPVQGIAKAPLPKTGEVFVVKMKESEHLYFARWQKFRRPYQKEATPTFVASEQDVRHAPKHELENFDESFVDQWFPLIPYEVKA